MKLNEFFLVFRRDYPTKDKLSSPAQLQKNWQDWLTSLATQDLLTTQLKRWDSGGRILSSGKQVMEGPYTEINAAIYGLITITAVNYQEAKEIAQSCPVLLEGGTVEIRMAV